MSDHPTAPGRSRAERRPGGPLDDTGRRTGGLGRPVDAPAGSRGRPPVPPLRPVPTGPRTTMAPFQAAVPAAGGADTPGPRDDLWTSSRPGRGQRGADRRAAGQREPERLEVERQETERQGTERLEAERLETERLETERLEAERRAAEQRAARQREVERREAQRREAERLEAERLQAERRVAEQRAAQQREPERRAAGDRPALPAAPRSGARSDDDRDGDWSTGPAAGRPRLPGPGRPAAAAAAAGGVAYGDWTRPSRSGAGDDTDPGRRLAEPEEDYSSQRFARLRAGAPTEETAAPERNAGARRRTADDRLGPEGDREERAGRSRGPETGPGPVTDPGSVTATIGGRAALRAERQAAEAARKKAARGADRPGRGGRRSPRRAVLGLVAVAVVALGVLGVYSFASPHTEQAASQSPATQSADNALGTVPGVSDLPPLSTVPAPTSAAPTTPVRVPVTVLNSTNITGLAASIAGSLKGGGWQTLPVGEYRNKDVATTTVYFTQGNEQQRQAALQLIQQFPQVHGPAVRFFNLPAGTADGLVVVATGDWKP